ncbi:MAG: 2-oxo acid dehydrogenase subunit E2 [Leptospiraceae bacterium]|nr:2-oxo acid dehydrogenase subunit E2 [Leptospiraceae bacterium]MCK6382024.1 2-oxo acid dehydrogenase subunit E2 [Leptospiraceae bacterium]
MAKITEMTQLSPTMAEGLMVKWIKKIGDSIEPGDILAEVETDKAVMELEAFDSGTILSIIAEEGKKVKVGLPIAIIGKSGEDVSALIQEAKKKLEDGSISNPIPEPAKASSKAIEEPVKPSVQVDPPPSSVKVLEPPPKSFGIPVKGKLIASPLAKSIALDKGLDITKVEGTGPGGRILKRDVLGFISNGKSQNRGRLNSAVTEDEIIEISGMRQVIAKRLHDAKNNIPHFYLNLEFDAEPVFELRKKINSDLKSLAEKKKEEPESVSINDMITKACSIALVKVPEANSSWRGDHILRHGRVDIGIAVSLDGGLITPYVRGADSLSLLEIHHEIKALADKARKRKLKPDEYTDGTFTISNLGMFGISSFSAIINEPEGALMAVGSLVEKPVVKNGTIVAGKTITVTLSCDHRVVDGAVGAKFLSEFKDLIEHPHQLLV